MKLALGMIVFNGMPFVEGVLKTWYPYVEQIVVAEGPVKFWRDEGYLHSTDGTWEAIEQFPDLNGKISYHVSSQWLDKLEMCNAWLRQVRDDITHVACFDSDEFMLKEDIEAVMNMLWREEFDSVGLRLFSFVGGFDRYLTGFEEKLEVMRFLRYRPGATFTTHRPPTLSTSKGGKHLSYNKLSEMGIGLYHYSHVLPCQVLAKERYYANYMGAENVIQSYYRNVWLPWVMTGDVGKNTIEQTWQGVHDFAPKYRGDCYSRGFLGRHPWWIEQNKERILKMQQEQIEQERCSNEHERGA